MRKLKTENLLLLKTEWKAASLAETYILSGLSSIILQWKQSISVKSMNQSQLP